MAEVNKMGGSDLSSSAKYSGLSDSEIELCEAALKFSENAYAPYSGFRIGAAVRTSDGAIYGGAKLENASYGMSISAETAALANANTATTHQPVAIAVIGRGEITHLTSGEPTYPCGSSRQIIHEASIRSGVDITILACNGDLTHVAKTSISKLLPNAFGPEGPRVAGQIGSKAAEMVETMQSSLEDRAESFLNKDLPRAVRSSFDDTEDEKIEEVLNSISAKFRK